MSDAGAATVVVSFVLFCLCSFKVPAPATALQVTLLVTSVRLPGQSVIFLPFFRKAMIFDPSTIRNCLLIPLGLLITNLSPILHPLSDILSITQRSTNSQWDPTRFARPNALLLPSMPGFDDFLALLSCFLPFLCLLFPLFLFFLPA